MNRRGRIKGIMVIAMALALSLAAQGFGYDASYAAAALKPDHTSESITQGSSAYMEFKLVNNGEAIAQVDKARLTPLSSSDKEGLSISDFSFGTSDSFPAGATRTIGFNVSADRTAGTGPRSFKIELLNGGVSVGTSEEIIIRIGERSSDSGSLTGYRVYNGDVSFTTNHGTSLETGNDNVISFRVKNSGTTAIKNADFTLSLPEGITVGSGYSNVEKLGSFGSGEVKSFSFPISVESGLYRKNYSFSVRITGSGFGSNGSDSAVSIERSFSIYVNGTKDSGEDEESGSLNDIAVSLETVPAEGLKTGEGNSLNFKLVNGGSVDIKNVSMLLSLPEGLAITSGGATSASFGTLKAGDTRNVSYPIYVEKGLYKKNYPLSVQLSGSAGSSERSFYVYIDGSKELDENGDESGESKNPQIMVKSFSYGGNSVRAGSSFNLSFVLYNTSDRNLKNVKVSGSSDGSFVPSGSSSFFIEGLKAKGTANGSLGFTTSPDAAQEAHAINIRMSYEDSEGNSYGSEDTISVPVVQQLRFVVEDVSIPSDVYVGEQTYAAVDYYNMGKTQVSNLRIRVEGEGFELTDSPSTYVGNVASGASDEFSFNFIPSGPEPASGRLIFTYEDAAGQEMTDEVPFSFTAMEMFVPDDWSNDTEPVEPENTGLGWKLYAGIAAAVIVGIVVLLKILKKRRLNKQLQLDSEDDE